MKNNNLTLFAKSIFQTTSIRLKLLFFKTFVGHKIPQEILIKNLKDRKFSWDATKPYKTFFICSINDWEVDLLNEFKIKSETYHFKWDKVIKYFEFKKDWILFQENLNLRLKKEFEEYYNENDNILIFIYASDFSIKSSVIKEFKRKNVLIISFCWDDLLYFKGKTKGQHFGISELSKVVDFNLTFSPECIPRYIFNNSPSFFWNSVNLEIDLNILPKIAYKYQEFYVLFIGSNYGWRSRFINKLIKNGICVKCYGNGWPNGRLTNEEMKIEVAKAPITLGFSNVGYTKNITTIKGRDFEVPIWKGLYITQFSSGLSLYYSLDIDVLSYKNLHECISKINYIKENTDIAFDIRKNGYTKAMIKASWRSRLLFLDDFIYENILNKIL